MYETVIYNKEYLHCYLKLQNGSACKKGGGHFYKFQFRYFCGMSHAII